MYLEGVTALWRCVAVATTVSAYFMVNLLGNTGCAYGGLSATGWSLLGWSVASAAWQLVDRRSGQSFSGNGGPYYLFELPLNNLTASRYRLVVTSAACNWLAVTGLALYGSAPVSGASLPAWAYQYAYPPAPLTGASTSVAAGYGSGVYNVTASSRSSTVPTEYLAFNTNASIVAGWFAGTASANTGYNGGSYLYQGTTSTLLNSTGAVLLGEWVELWMPGAVPRHVGQISEAELWSLQASACPESASDMQLCRRTCCARKAFAFFECSSRNVGSLGAGGARAGVPQSVTRLHLSTAAHEQ